MKDSDNKGEIAKNIRCKIGKIKLDDFAKMVGVNKDQLSRYRTGKSVPRADIYEKIMRFQKPEEKRTPVAAEGMPLVREPPPDHFPERRNPDNRLRREFVGKVLRILDSGKEKQITALESNVEAFLENIKLKESEMEGGD